MSILDYLTRSETVQTVFVFGCFVSIITLASFRKWERHEERELQAERERRMLVDHSKS